MKFYQLYLSTKKEQPLCHHNPIKYTCWCKLCMQVSVASCQSKFAVHEVMICVANLKVHLRDCTGNVNTWENVCYVICEQQRHWSDCADSAQSQTARIPRSLISAFVVRCLDSIISLDSIAEISRPISFCGCAGQFVVSWLMYKVMYPKGADRIVKEQSDLGTHCLPRSVCLKQ